MRDAYTGYRTKLSRVVFIDQPALPNVDLGSVAVSHGGLAASRSAASSQQPAVATSSQRPAGQEPGQQPSSHPARASEQAGPFSSQQPSSPAASQLTGKREKEEGNKQAKGRAQEA